MAGTRLIRRLANLAIRASRSVSACRWLAVVMVAMLISPLAPDVLVAPASFATATVQPFATTTAGYWMVTSHGAMMSFGNVALFGSTGTIPLNAPVVAMAPTPDYRGYWLVAADGGIFAFGDAHFYGSMGGRRLNKPIVSITADPATGGYWEVASDGGIFSFNAPFYGSMGGRVLNKPIVGIASAPGGRGYWEVASDGGIFAFGDAPFYGSMGGRVLNAPIVGIASAPDGHGYWEVASDGGIFAFGDAHFYGSMGGRRLNGPIVSISAAPDGLGYWMVGADGGVFSFGSAHFRGSAGNFELRKEPVVMLVGAPGSGTAPNQGRSEGLQGYPQGASGYDISFPQCGSAYPRPSAVGIVGVEDGSPFSTNPCLASEASWAGIGLSVYLNTSFYTPGGAIPSQAQDGPAGACAPADMSCEGYNLGYANAIYAVHALEAAGVAPQSPINWWLDVEMGNNWSANSTANARVIQGSIDALRAQGLTVGIYSTVYQWDKITGGYAPTPAVPEWYPSGSASYPPSQWCSSSNPISGTTDSFTGGPIWMVQEGPYDNNASIQLTYDEDFVC